MIGLAEAKRAVRYVRARVSPPGPTLQQHFFETALEEASLPLQGLRIDHHTGRCFHPDLGWRGMTFPVALLAQIEALPQEKTRETFFAGVISENRAWLHDCDGVKHSEYGRKPDTKYGFHEDYYRDLCAARFGLAPVGECPWSYRFFEAIMCRAIPVLGPHDEDVYADAFIHTRHGEALDYDEAACAENLARFKAAHMLKV